MKEEIVLFHQRLEQPVKEWSRERCEEVPELFQRICEQAYGEAQRDAP